MTSSFNFVGDRESLFAGLSTLVRGLLYPRQAEQTLCSFFSLAVKGLAAERAGLFLICHKPSAIRLETLCSFELTQQELRAVEANKDLEQSGLACVWKVVARQEMTTDPPAYVGDHPAQLLRLSSNRYILCLLVFNPVVEAPVAVLYLETSADPDPEYEALLRQWAEVYSLALGQLIHVGFPPAKKQTPNSYGDIQSPENAPDLVGDSLHTQALRAELHEIHIPAASVPDPDPILILGEKGTGKDLVARYIYAHSSRRKWPYVAVNCAEITDEMATARFFGHKRGSFTGSLASEPGLFRAADHGVLFLDEIGDLSLKSQGTLLRVLENRTVVPLGETKETRIDVQVILGTNCDLETVVRERRMRADLVDRFRTHEIRLAPLRDRPWDIPALTRYFIAYHEKRTQKKTLGVHPDVLKKMVGYSWPGNVRELARVCSLLITHVKPGMAIDHELFNRLVPYISSEERNPKAGGLLAGDVPMRDALETFGRELILSRLRQHNWNIRSARESLGLPKTTFHRYTRTLGIADSVRGEIA